MPKTDSSKKELDTRSDFRGGDIVLYTAPDGTMKLDVRLEKETVWLTQQLMAELFQTTKQNIGQPLKSIFQDGELAQKAVVKNFFTTAANGKSYDTNFYNLDAIISVGYRVNSKRGTQFRIWATNVLRDHLLKGYSVNERRLQELNQAVRLVADVASQRKLTGDEATALLRVVGEYSLVLDLLDDYDYQRLAAPGAGATVIHTLSCNEAVRYPTGFGHWLCAGDGRTMGLAAKVHTVWRPNLVMAVSPAPPPPGAPGPLADRLMVDGQPIAYVCEGSVCRQPATRPEDLRAQLR